MQPLLHDPNSYGLYYRTVYETFQNHEDNPKFERIISHVSQSLLQKCTVGELIKLAAIDKKYYEQKATNVQDFIRIKVHFYFLNLIVDKKLKEIEAVNVQLEAQNFFFAFQTAQQMSDENSSKRLAFVPIVEYYLKCDLERAVFALKCMPESQEKDKLVNELKTLRLKKSENLSSSKKQDSCKIN